MAHAEHNVCFTERMLTHFSVLFDVSSLKFNYSDNN